MSGEPTAVIITFDDPTVSEPLVVTTYGSASVSTLANAFAAGAFTVSIRYTTMTDVVVGEAS